MSDGNDAFLSEVNGTWYLEYKYDTYKFKSKQDAINFYHRLKSK